MKKIQILALATITLALGACSNDEDMPVAKNETITVNASIGKMTRVAYAGNTSTFEIGDQINVYAWTGDNTEVAAERIVDGAINTFDGVAWTAAPQMLWADMTTPHYFLAVYPTRDITDFKADPFTLDVNDQIAADILVATRTEGLVAQENPVQLTFNHAMAKIIVNLHFRNQWGGVPMVESVKYEGYAAATIDYLAGVVTGTYKSDVTLPEILSVPVNFELSYSSIVIPAPDTKTIRISIDGQDYTYTHPTYIPLEAGKYTTINLNVGRDEITLADDVIINDWVEGEIIDGGEAQL